MTLIVFAVAVIALAFPFMVLLKEEDSKATEEQLERLRLIKMNLDLIESDYKQKKITKEQYEAEKKLLWEELDEIEEEIND